MSAAEHHPVSADLNQPTVQEVGLLHAPVEAIGSSSAPDSTDVGEHAESIELQEQQDATAVEAEQHEYVMAQAEALRAEIEVRMARHTDVEPASREMLHADIAQQVASEAYARRLAMIQEHGGGEEGVAKLHQAEAARTQAEEARLTQEKAPSGQPDGSLALPAAKESSEQPAAASATQEPEPVRPDHIPSEDSMSMGAGNSAKPAIALAEETYALEQIAALERQYGTEAAKRPEYAVLADHLAGLNLNPDRTPDESEALWRARINTINETHPDSDSAPVFPTNTVGRHSRSRQETTELPTTDGEADTTKTAGTGKSSPAAPAGARTSTNQPRLKTDKELGYARYHVAWRDKHLFWGAPARFVDALRSRSNDTAGSPKPDRTAERRQKAGRVLTVSTLGVLAASGVGVALNNGDADPGTEVAGHSVAAIAPPPALSGTPERPANSIAGQVAEQLQPIGKYNSAAKEGMIGSWGKDYAAKHGYSTDGLTPKQASIFVDSMKDELLKANNLTEASATMVGPDYTPRNPLSVDQIHRLHDSAKAS